MSTATTAAVPTESKGKVKRDFLADIEHKVQRMWSEEKAWEENAPIALEKDTEQQGYMATFPYPYMNGMLHLGHAFTVSKAEFAIAYQRMRGKKCLFPFGFHCTGMPIKASADKLVKEYESRSAIGTVSDASDHLEDNATCTAETKNKHSKVAAKTGNAKSQWDIMLQLGIPENEIPLFRDPEHWVKYFPVFAKKDLTSLGCHIDWRRSFITTDLNPFYDSFVKWQFRKLKKLGKIKFGKRQTIFSVLDGQACLDHDRSSGEGVLPKEYTIIKLKVLWQDECGKREGEGEGEGNDIVYQSTLRSQETLLKAFGGCCEQSNDTITTSATTNAEKPTIFLGAATVRPETIYGLTNCWLGPDVEYGLFRLANGSDWILCTERSALNMLYQGILREPLERPEGLGAEGRIKGSSLMGLMLDAPLSPMEKIPVLPMFNVSSGIGTGVVGSVPSNSPADYLALRDLKEKQALREKFSLETGICSALEPINIIRTESWGACGAERIVQEMKIKSQNDGVSIDAAKETLYKDDFYSGQMIVGGPGIEGLLVKDVKTTIKDLLEAKKIALPYCEPEKKVVSRSGDECIVALIDQWFIDYGEPSWRAEAEECLEGMNVFCEDTRNQFKATLAWMNKWACSRSFGLGSKVPWDPEYLIESLSDSTVYMAFYCVCHILQEGSLDGSVPNKDGISPPQMTDEVWDWIYAPPSDCHSPPADIGIPSNIIEKMRAEFRFWYPMDLRVSGKDLVPNHLTFSIYNHVALFDRAFWPKGMRANGHLLLNNEKMSKSTGNFMTLKDAVDEWGADATRFALADAGDSVEDANFLKDTANMAILRLYNEIALLTEFKDLLLSEGEGDQQQQNTLAPLTSNDLIMESEINLAIQATTKAYEETSYREALMKGFFELQNARDRYRAVVGDKMINPRILKRFVAVQALLLCPICPHFSEHVWTTFVSNDERISSAQWPVAGPIDYDILQSGKYLQNVAHSLRLAMQAENRAAEKAALKAKKEVVTKVERNAAKVFVATSFPAWQECVMEALKEFWDSIGKTFSLADGDLVKVVRERVMKLKNPTGVAKKLIPYLMDMKSKMKAAAATSGSGEDALKCLKVQVPFNEEQVLRENIDFLSKSIGLLKIDIEKIDPSSPPPPTASTSNGEGEADLLKKMESTIPGLPTGHFYFEKN